MKRLNDISRYLRFIPLEVNSKDYNLVVEERGNYKETYYQV